MTFPSAADVERLDDQLTAWRWYRSLYHRLRVAELCFEHAWLEPEEQDALAEVITDFRIVCEALARRGSAA
jgi:hypothetical protein